MTLEYNIIYTPGTVKYLSFFVWSLLDQSDATFRLVSNGCLPAERRYLQHLCHQDKRLTYWTMPGKGCMPHGQVLNALHSLCRANFFCFIDSDIFATGAFAERLATHLQSLTAVFTGMPVWVKKTEAVMPQSFHQMVGTFNRADNGICLGSTYAAHYDKQVLIDFTQSSGIGFDAYHWHELPEEVQHTLTSLGLQKTLYDTGKVLNLLLFAQGAQLQNVDAETLCHLGGTSFQVHYDSMPRSLRHRIINRLMQSKVGRPVKLLKRRRAISNLKQHYRHVTDAEFQFNVRQRTQYRDPVRQYLLQLISSLMQGAPAPHLPTICDPEISQNLLAAKDQLIHLYQRYRGNRSHAFTS